MKNKKYNIGLIVADIDNFFSNFLAKGAMRATEKTGDNLFIFPVRYMNLARKGTRENPKLKYDYQYNFMTAYAKSNKIDVILLALSSICFRSGEEKINRILSYFSDYPIILLCSQKDGCSSVMYNNDIGLRAGIEYLINVRGCKHLYMVAGLRTNEDSNEREAIFLDVMNKHGLKTNSGDIVRIHDSNICDEDVEEIIVKHPDVDAIVCFNDETAMGAYKALRRHGLEPGKDVAVIGFDDNPTSTMIKPTLSSVRADASLISEKAVYMAVDMLKKNDLTPRVEKVDTKFIIRESASGVKDESLSIEEYQAKIEEYENKILEVDTMDIRMNIVNRDMLMFGSSNVKYYTHFLEALKMPEIGDCFLYLFEKPQRYMPYSEWNLPSHINLVAYKINQVVNMPRGQYKSIKIDDIYENRYFKPNGRQFVFVDVYSRNIQYGIMICEMPYKLFRYVDQLCFQISIAVKIMHLFSKNERSVNELRQSNLMLGDISTKDELTAIYNRRGFITEINRIISNNRMYGKKAALFFADLNYLKLINDRFGHNDGDFALRECASALLESFDENAFIGRIGGDEFAVFTIVDDKSTAWYIDEIKQNMKDRDMNNAKEYPVLMSVGVHEFVINDKCDLKNIMDLADANMYIEKKKKPQFVKNNQ